MVYPLDYFQHRRDWYVLDPLNPASPHFTTRGPEV